MMPASSSHWFDHCNLKNTGIQINQATFRAYVVKYYGKFSHCHYCGL
jgi:hypothetical protein